MWILAEYIPLTFSFSQFENKYEKKYKYSNKHKYKYDKYLLRSKYMTPPNGVKVDGHIPSSTNAWQLLSCLLLRIGKVVKNHSLALHLDYLINLMNSLGNK